MLAGKTIRWLPASGPLRGTAGQITGFVKWYDIGTVIEPPRGRPVGGGGVHHYIYENCPAATFWNSYVSSDAERRCVSLFYE